MSRIGSIGSLSSGQLSALSRIRKIGAAIEQNTQRLSTLKRINSAKDDPSGLISASVLRQELTAASTTYDGITRANAILSTADAAASEILTNLQTARGLALEAAGGTLSDAEIAANQVELDSILGSLSTLTQTAFGDRRLLDGTSGFRVRGADAGEVLDVDVLSKSTASDVSVSINVTQQAAQATDTYDNSVALAADTTLIVTGARGSATLTLSAGATTQEISDAFDAASYLTGIEATVNGTDVNFNSIEYGSDATIEIEVTEGTFVTDGGNSAAGTDVEATVDGQAVTGDGTTLSVVTSELAAIVELDPSASGALTSFTVSGEGLAFVVGASVTNTARVGLPNLHAASLGGATGNLHSLGNGGANSLTSGNATDALQILDDAIADVTRSQAVIGGFQRNVLDSSASVLSKQIENVSEALSSVEDADLAYETAQLANNQLLQQSAYEALRISSLNSDGVLSLLMSVAARF